MVKTPSQARKPISLLLSVTLVSCCIPLTGCSNAEDSDNKTTEVSQSSDDVNAASQNKSAGDITPKPPLDSEPAEDPGPTIAEKPVDPTSPALPNNAPPADTRQTPPSSAEKPTTVGNSEAAALARLEKQLADFKVPPDWLADVKPAWSTNKPWKEGRQEIRRLLGQNNETSRRQAIKLTWDYLQKNDIGDGHEYGMYMFMGGEPLWAILVYRERIKQTGLKYPPYFGMKALASLYADYGVFTPGEEALKLGMTMSPPDARWNEMRQAELHDALGDLYLAWGKLDQAKASYREAIRLYPLGKPPYGRHLLPRRVKKVQSKLDLLSIASLEGATLRDGTYRDRALGYSGDINLTIRIQGGRIADIKVQHQEKIDQNACVLIPQRIIDSQSLQVDGISGATVTKDAIIGGTLRGLKQAGLK